MSTGEYWTWCMGTALFAATVAQVAAADPAARVAPLHVQVTVVGASSHPRGLDARMVSLFDADTQLEFQYLSQLPADSVLAPSGSDDLYLWILLSPDAHARVYAAVRGTSGSSMRYLFRDVLLESGLDEVGSETLSHIAHSSVLALWQRKQETSRQILERELARDTTKSSLKSAEPSPKQVAPPLAPGRMVPLLPTPGAHLRVPAPVVAPAPIVVGAGATMTAHASGNEGWLFSPGVFLTLERQWSLRLAGGYLLPHEFVADPALVRLSGGTIEARAGWVLAVAPGSGLRVRPELGIGALFVSWRTQAPSPATALAGGTSRRDYAVLSLAGELPLGPIWLGARGELRVPFQKTSYDVIDAGKPVSVANSWLNPGIGIVIGIPFTRSSDEKTR